MVDSENIQSLAPTPSFRAGLAWSKIVITKPFDWISTTLYIGSCASLTYDRTFLGGSNLRQIEWWQIGVILVATVFLLVLDRYESWRWGEEIAKPVALRLFLLRAGLVGLISWLNFNEITIFTYLIIPFTALVYFGGRFGLLVAALTWLIFVGRLVIFSSSYPLSENFKFMPLINMFTLCLVFIMTSGYTLRREKASRLKAERLFAELAQSQKQVAELAATRERNRLARDIHDSLGHYLTVISVLLGKAKAFKLKSPVEADQALDDARRLANEALQDVRESVKSLRTSQELFSLERTLPILVAGLNNHYCRINLKIEGQEEGFSKQILMVLYRVAQEGLTNIQRHAACEEANLKVSFLEQTVELVLEDNGHGFDPQLKAASGYGLRGLQERLEMVGGEFWLESQPGKGTRLTARVSRQPAPESDSSPARKDF